MSEVRAVPKPVPALPKPRQFGTSLPVSEKPIGRNKERQAREFIRCYESEARVVWVKAIGCVICGKRPSENAHIRGGGGGRKADSRFIVPLCYAHHQGRGDSLHRQGPDTFEAMFSINLDATADRIEAEWQAHRATQEAI